MTVQVLIPDIGEAKDVEVIEILVSQGETVEADASLVVLESDKASMEIPSPTKGTVAQVHVSVGDNVDEGDLLLELEPAPDLSQSQCQHLSLSQYQSQHQSQHQSQRKRMSQSLSQR